MGDDISKKMVAILLVIAVLISVIGTWLVLTQEPEVKVENLQGQGLVKFAISNGESNKPALPVTGNSVVGFSVN